MQRRRLAVPPTLLTAILLAAILLAAYTLAGRTGNQPASTAQLQATATTYDTTLPAVHVCAANHWSADHTACTQDDATIPLAQMAQARLVFSNGTQPFTSHHAHFIVSTARADGTFTQIRQFNRSDIPLARTAVAFPLATLFQQGRLTPRAATYQIEIDAPTSGPDDAFVGTATFTLR